MESAVRIRNKVNHWIYVNVVKNIAFAFEAEKTHKFFLKIGKVLGKFALTRRIIRDMYHYENPILRQKILGIEFSNPVGLSAGFDKNGEIIDIVENVGFGFSEIGSVTKLECAGNPGKRIERIKKRKALWINLGLNNDGVNVIADRLRGKKHKMPFGVSIAKTNCKETANDDIGIEDYAYSLEKFNREDIGNFYVLNISCPNSYGGQPFSRPKAYELLLRRVDKIKVKKPIFIKLSPDMGRKETDAILKISRKHKVSGFVISNLTKKHERSKGGMSGKVVQHSSEKMLSYVYSKTKGKYILIGVGGIFSAEDAYRKIKLGANLVELITGMIYEGPNLISEINLGMADFLRKEGYKNIREAVGKGAKN